MNPHIFREYDIRGTYPDELNEKTVGLLGNALGAYYREKGAKRISLGQDCRLSSPDLAAWLSRALVASGMEIVDIGTVPTPVLYFSIHHLRVDGGIQITGSHNPPAFNGFKICLGEMSVYGEEIQKIRKIAESGDFIAGNGKVGKTDVRAAYIDYVTGNIQLGSVKRKVVVDGGNGTGGPVGTEIYRRLGFETVPLFCEPDGSFPNHHPDPTIPQNLELMVAKVRETKADLGIAYDGDADRIGVVDSQGDIVWGDQLMIIFSRDLLTRHPGAKIIGEVKCSQTLYDDVAAHGGKAIMWKAGHSPVKSKMKAEGALLAGEMTGHLFFGERYFGYDDAIYAGARLLEILSKTDKRVEDLLAGVPRMATTPEIRVDCPDDQKFAVVAAITEDFRKTHDVIDIDGARVRLDGGWGLVRASNTQPALVLRFEATDQECLEEIRTIFMEKVERWL
ncbi:MAG: phosphomannomutase/phosphoglucomutase [Desulfobacteraceae bacterium]|nr:phosphomannomutase/phosphoglucomutase [Desulfobacterales bacterium]MBL6967848.1 phosphomannomutase/phosphoglucomutase [Desulfobacteraceae bacterium]MBL7101904.1 phosphomannomutase/phosphoglucomutase [Desulfobacteraceae bacterium]